MNHHLESVDTMIDNYKALPKALQDFFYESISEIRKPKEVKPRKKRTPRKALGTSVKPDGEVKESNVGKWDIATGKTE